MKTRSKQPHKARGVSLPEDMNNRVEKRLQELQPKVKGFSHYIQLLVDWDLNGNGTERRPFNDAQAQLPGLELAA